MCVRLYLLDALPTLSTQPRGCCWLVMLLRRSCAASKLTRPHSIWSAVAFFAQAEALAEFTDVQMALNLHVNEEVR